MNHERPIRYFSTFSGIGGFELGIGDRGKCVGYSELDRYAAQIYQKHFPTHTNYGDITKINAEALPDFDLLVGGFPCQSFSIAGKRGGFADTRGTLFFDLARILRAKQPRLFLFENVKGLLSHDEGRTFLTIITTLDELGYDIQWQVLNSKDFGVPQNRERIFIAGHLRGTPRPEVFPVIGQINPHTTQSQSTKTSVARALTGGGHSGGNHSGMTIVGTLRTHKDGNGFREVKSGVAPTIPARARNDGSGQPVIAIPVLTPDRLEKRQNGRRFKENGDPSFTLTSQDKHGIYDGVVIRRLTPVECERLQGFPDGWTAIGTSLSDDEYGRSYETSVIRPISDTQRYKTLGNAVTVNVIEAICRKLLK